MSVTGLSAEQKAYLVQIKQDVETVLRKLQSLKRLGFDSLKDVDRINAEIEDKKIDLTYIPHLNTQFTVDKVTIINSAIDNLLTVVGQLQGAINRQKNEIRRTIDKYQVEINAFLKTQGIPIRFPLKNLRIIRINYGYVSAMIQPFRELNHI